PKMVTFVDRNGVELTVTPSKFEQLKKCGLLPANAGQPSKVKSNLAKNSHHKKVTEKLAPKVVTENKSEDEQSLGISKERLAFAQQLIKEAQEAPLPEDDGRW
uniref:Uncharacterized protein n=1 Tax=Clytia hemisphaerica TaxID=252671 RepID=A0A7M5XBD6_9CNID